MTLNVDHYLSITGNMGITLFWENWCEVASRYTGLSYWIWCLRYHSDNMIWRKRKSVSLPSQCSLFSKGNIKSKDVFVQIICCWFVGFSFQKQWMNRTELKCSWGVLFFKDTLRSNHFFSGLNTVFTCRCCSHQQSLFITAASPLQPL